ncbi:hypothetical protein PGSY75_1220700 [Plasmodium gaboni]|uniref:Uncharacterized protein n=1 Tax=Plasmodium gaboni TaxID=647221 RepID=A0A151LGD7_9APIC|nr:hypothetical protein PGSY75_1220700 [Plasmodium gaboni]KYN98012.1 hypothetical protein PGSY75_1220700 [Plasmodium gaboni]
MNTHNNNDHLNNIYLEFSLLNNFLKELKENIKKSNNEKYTNIYDGCVEYIYTLHNKYTAWNYNTEKIDEKYIEYFVQSIILNIKNFLRNQFCLIDEDIECLKNKNKKLMEKLKSGVENAETQENYIYELEKKLIFEKEKNKSSYNLHEKINNLLKLNEQLTNKNEQLECSSFKHKQENDKMKIELKKFWALKEKKKKYEQNKFSYYMLNKKMSTLLKKINNHIPTHQNNYINEKNRSYSYNFVHTLKKYIILRDSHYLSEFNINTYTNNDKKGINNNIDDNNKMYDGNEKYDDNNKMYDGKEKYDDNNKMYDGKEKYDDNNKMYDSKEKYDDNNKMYDGKEKYDNDDDNKKCDAYYHYYNNKNYNGDNNKYCCDNKDTNFKHLDSSINPNNTKYICYENSEYIKNDDICQGNNDTLNYHNKNINKKHTQYVKPENSSSSNNSNDIYNINKRDKLSIHKTKHIQTYETVPRINHFDTYINEGDDEEEHNNNDEDGKKDKLYNFTNNLSMYKMYNNSEITCTEESDNLYKNIEYINKKKTFYTNDNNKDPYLINNIKLKNSNTLNEAYFSRRILYSTTLLMDIRKTLRYNRKFLKNSILCKRTKKIKRKKEKLKTLTKLHQKNDMINDYHHSNDEMHAIKNMLIEDYRGTIIKFYECIKKDIRIIIESNYNLNLDLLSQHSQNIIREIHEEKNILRKKKIDKITRKYLRQIDSYRLCEKDFYHNIGNEENKNEKHLYLNYHKYDSLDLRKILKNNYQQNTYDESEEPFSFNFYEHGNIKIIDRLKELKSNISFFKFYDLIDFPTRI